MTEAQRPAAAFFPNGNSNNSQKTSSTHLERAPNNEQVKAQQEPKPQSEPRAGQGKGEGGEDDASVPPLSATTADLHARVSSFLKESHEPSSILSRVQKQTRISLSVINEARSRYKISELSLSYNGGKDCLVMLILFLSSLHQQEKEKEQQQQQQQQQQQPSEPSSNTPTTTPTFEPHPKTIPAIYAQPPHPFSSVESFVESSSRLYHLALTRCITAPPAKTIRSAFASYLDLHPQIRAIFVGTRRTDPHGASLTHFDKTDHGWPDFMRIHPVVDWHYAEIWAFIRHLGIDYCPLYDEGYTSLGGTDDTHPNPMLLRKTSASASNGGGGSRNGDSSQKKSYRPAYELMDDDEERLGRH